MTLLIILFTVLLACFAVLAHGYHRLRLELAAVYSASTDTFDEFTETLEIGSRAMIATAGYGAYMQDLAYTLVTQIEDPGRRQELLEQMSGARMQYLSLHPTADTMDPLDYMFTDDTPPPPLEI